MAGFFSLLLSIQLQNLCRVLINLIVFGDAVKLLLLVSILEIDVVSRSADADGRIRRDHLSVLPIQIYAVELLIRICLAGRIVAIIDIVFGYVHIRNAQIYQLYLSAAIRLAFIHAVFVAVVDPAVLDGEHGGSPAHRRLPVAAIQLHGVNTVEIGVVDEEKPAIIVD